MTTIATKGLLEELDGMIGEDLAEARKAAAQLSEELAKDAPDDGIVQGHLLDVTAAMMRCEGFAEVADRVREYPGAGESTPPGGAT